MQSFFFFSTRECYVSRISKWHAIYELQSLLILNIILYFCLFCRFAVLPLLGICVCAFSFLLIFVFSFVFALWLWLFFFHHFSRFYFIFFLIFLVDVKIRQWVDAVVWVMDVGTIIVSDNVLIVIRKCVCFANYSNYSTNISTYAFSNR